MTDTEGVSPVFRSGEYVTDDAGRQYEVICDMLDGTVRVRFRRQRTIAVSCPRDQLARVSRKRTH